MKWVKVRIINNKIYQLIGLSKRAGKIVSGSFAVENAIRSGKARLVIVSDEASANTVKKFRDMCEYRKVDIIQFGSKKALGECIGKTERTLLAITDIAFRDMIIRVLPSSITKMGVMD
jgi:ribosomal protein L7Ae-like RNA K-turn-binding protein